MIRVDVSRCSGCRMCEVACAFYHTGKVNRNLARIKVVQIFEKGIDGPVVCQQCSERYCLDCPENALSIGPRGQVIVSPTLCSQCGKCVRECPIGAIEIFDEIARVCDLCGDSPRCVISCSREAIVFDSHLSESVSLKDRKGETKKFSATEKRTHHILQLGETDRKLWRQNDE